MITCDFFTYPQYLYSLMALQQQNRNFGSSQSGTSDRLKNVEMSLEALRNVIKNNPGRPRYFLYFFILFIVELLVVYLIICLPFSLCWPSASPFLSADHLPPLFSLLTIFPPFSLCWPSSLPFLSADHPPSLFSLLPLCLPFSLYLTICPSFSLY